MDNVTAPTNIDSITNPALNAKLTKKNIAKPGWADGLAQSHFSEFAKTGVPLNLMDCASLLMRLEMEGSLFSLSLSLSLSSAPSPFFLVV